MGLLGHLSTLLPPCRGFCLCYAALLLSSPFLICLLTPVCMPWCLFPPSHTQFCYTGRMGLLGHLSTAQIIEQVVEAKRLMQEEGDSTPATNIVFMVRRGGRGNVKEQE